MRVCIHTYVYVCILKYDYIVCNLGRLYLQKQNYIMETFYYYHHDAGCKSLPKMDNDVHIFYLLNLDQQFLSKQQMHYLPLCYSI